MLNRIIVFVGLFISLQVMAQGAQSDVLDQVTFKKEISKKGIQLIDVRTPEEFNAGHIPNAININFMSSDFKTQISKLNKNKAVYVYCQAGGRSAKASKMFLENGFKEVHDLKGGFGGWKE